MSKEIQWTTYEYHAHDKSADWFWVYAIISLSFVILAILFREFLLAILILMASITMAILTKKAPKMISIAIDENGFFHDDIFYSYEMLKKFWIRTDALTNPELMFKTNSIMHPYIVVTIPQNKKEDIKELLQNRVTEEEFEEPFSHQFFDYFGF